MMQYRFSKLRPTVLLFILLAPLSLLIARQHYRPISYLQETDSYRSVSHAINIQDCLQKPNYEIDNYADLIFIETHEGCVWRMSRPFLYPLLLKFGEPALHLTQAALYSLSFAMLGFALWSWPYHALVKIIGTIALWKIYMIRDGSVNLLMPDSLNLSIWLIIISLIALFLARRNLWILAAVPVMAVALSGLKESSGYLVMPILLWEAWVLWRLWRQNPRTRNRYLLATMAILILLSSGWSFFFINNSPRRLYTFSNHVIFQLGKPFTLWPQHINQYKEMYEYDWRDPNWFYHRHPELTTMPIPEHIHWPPFDHPLSQFFLNNVEKDWPAFVITHLPSILLAQKYYQFKFINKEFMTWINMPIFIAVTSGAMAGGLWWIITERPNKKWLITGLLVYIFMADFFLALIGDAVELQRHAFLSISLLPFIAWFLFLHAVEATVLFLYPFRRHT